MTHQWEATCYRTDLQQWLSSASAVGTCWVSYVSQPLPLHDELLN